MFVQVLLLFNLFQEYLNLPDITGTNVCGTMYNVHTDIYKVVQDTDMAGYPVDTFFFGWITGYPVK